MGILGQGSRYGVLTGLRPSSGVHVPFNPKGPTKIYYVATTGNDNNPGSFASPFLTVNHGASVLNPGDTLYIRGGVYAESLVSVIPSGTSWSVPVTVSAYQSEIVTLRPTSGNFVLHFGNNATSLHYIQILNLVLDAVNISVSSGAAVKITDDGTHVADHIRLQNCDVKNVPAGVDATASQGILVTVNSAAGLYCDSNEFLNCKIHDIGGVGGAGNNEQGLYIQSSNNLIDGCDIYNCSSYGMQIYHSSSIADGTDCSNNIVRYCKFHGNASGTSSGSGEVLIGMGVNNLFHDNLIYGGISGVKVSYAASGTLIYFNTIYGNTNVNFGGLRITGISGGFAAPSGTIAKNNILYANGNDYTDLGTSTTSNYNLTGDNTAVGANSLANTNPVFLNQLSSDFRLATFSTAVSAGVAIGGYTVDYAGGTRASPPDIGAYDSSYARTPLTYYVDGTNGSDSNAGSLAAPFLTIAKGLKLVAHTDTLDIRTGTYATSFGSTTPGGLDATHIITIQAHASETVTIQPTSGSDVVQLTSAAQHHIKFSNLIFDAANCTSRAVYITSGSGQAHDITISGGEVKNATAGHDGITISGGTGSGSCTINGVAVHNNGNYGIFCGAASCTISNCDIYSNTDRGIYLTIDSGTQADSATVNANKVRSNGNQGIFVDAGTNSVLSNNLCYSNTNAGITATQKAGATLSGIGIYFNSISSNNSGLGSSGGLTVGGGTGAIVKDNACANNTTKDYNATGGTVTTENYNCAKDGTFVGANSLHADPLWTSAGTGDFTLQAGSTCIGAGTAITGITTDYNGATQNSPPDIGAIKH